MLALFKKGMLHLSAPARCVVGQFGEVYHLSLIAEAPEMAQSNFLLSFPLHLRKIWGQVF